MQIRTFLADDEPAARVRLRRLLDRHTQVKIIGEAANGIEAVEAIERLRPELLFLDIQMPGLSGFEVLKGLSKDIPRPLTIFVTASTDMRWKPFGQALLPTCSSRSRKTTWER